jgi:hypothetical protein
MGQYLRYEYDILAIRLNDCEVRRCEFVELLDTLTALASYYPGVDMAIAELELMLSDCRGEIWRLATEMYLLEEMMIVGEILE